MPGQFLPLHIQQNGEWAHLQGLKLSHMNPSDVMVVIGADVPEAFVQLDIRNGKEDQPLAIWTLFGWKIFGSSKRCSPKETKTVAINTTMLSCELELYENVKKFWEFDSKIAESANESGYSQEDVKCIKILHQKTK